MGHVAAAQVLAQLPADLLPSLVLLVVLLLAVVLVTGGLRSSPNGAVALPLPGKGLRRLLVALLLLLMTFAWLDSLDQSGRDRGRRPPVFVVYESRTPNIARHVRDALRQGYPNLLHRADAARRAANRRAACGRWRGPLSCDEYPFASTYEGGRGASIRGVPLQEQRRQGGDLVSFYTKHRVGIGDAYYVVVRK